MKKRTRTYRRDVTPKGIHWAQTDTKGWDAALKMLEKYRSRLPKQFEQDEYVYGNYDQARRILEEVGSIEGTPTARDARFSAPADRKRAMQEVLTRISKVLDPKDKADNQQGQGTGGKEDGDEDSGEGQFSEDKDEEEYSPGGTHGGGAQHYSESKDQSIFYATRFLIKKLAEHDDRTARQVLGHDTWNAQKLMAAKYKPNELPIAKEGWGKQVDDIYLCLDTSGSVNEWAQVIAGVAAGSAGIVHLYSGSEANPDYYVQRQEPLAHPHAPFPEWTHQRALRYWTGDIADWHHFSDAFVREYRQFYPHLGENSFETRLAWFLKTQKPKKGSRLLFWGDTEGVGIYAPRLLKNLVANYRMAWLLSENFWYLQRQENLEAFLEEVVANPDDYDTWEYPKLMAVDIPVIPSVTSPEDFRRALRQLQLQK